MRSIRPIVFALSFTCFHIGVASAEDPAPPKTTATRPVREHPNETSVPNNSAPMKAQTDTTGSTNQSPVVKEMNSEEKRKIEVEGK